MFWGKINILILQQLHPHATLSCVHMWIASELQIEKKKQVLHWENKPVDMIMDYAKHNCTLMQENAGKKVEKLITLQMNVLRKENNMFKGKGEPGADSKGSER